MPTRNLQPITLDPDLDPWERQPGETPKRHGQFVVYRDLGRARTLTKVAETLTLNAGYVRQLAAAGQWVLRAEEHDRHRDRLHEAAWLDERRRAAEHDSKLLGAAIGKLAGRLSTLRPEEMSVADFVRLLDVTMRHRRALFGDPAMTVAVTGPGGDPLSVRVSEFLGMGDEQRRLAMEDLVSSVTRRMEAARGTLDDD